MNSTKEQFGSLNQLAKATAMWQDENFSPVNIPLQALKLQEEAGEVAKAVVCAEQNVRPDTRGNLGEELADVILCAVSLAHRAGIDIDRTLYSRYLRLMTLDFRADPEASQNK